MIGISLRLTPNEATGTSPHETLFGLNHQNEIDWGLSQRVLKDEGANPGFKVMARGLQFLRTAVKENIESSRTMAKKILQQWTGGTQGFSY